MERHDFFSVTARAVMTIFNMQTVNTTINCRHVAAIGQLAKAVLTSRCAR